VAQVLEESRQAQHVHAARGDWRRLRHALPLVVVVGTTSLYLMKPESNIPVRSIALHLSEAHGSDVDTAGANDARFFWCGRKLCSRTESEGLLLAPCPARLVVQNCFGELRRATVTAVPPAT
jgi:hypothetical protein